LGAAALARGLYQYSGFEKPALQRFGRRVEAAKRIEKFATASPSGPGDFGNAIRGPLGIHRGANRRFWFYGADYTLEGQVEYLKNLRKVTEDELRRFIAGKELPHPAVVSRPTRSFPATRRTGGGWPTFRILDHLAILIEDPRFYHCWAGCSKEMIRAALGFPIRVRTYV